MTIANEHAMRATRLNCSVAILGGEESVQGKRAAAYLGFASVLAACAGAGYRALHPYSAAPPEGVLIWPSPEPVSKPLLVQASPAERKMTVVQWSASWPSNPSSAAVPFFIDMIQMGISLNDDEEDSEDPATEVPPQPGSERTAYKQAQKTPEGGPALSTGTTGQGSPSADVAGKSSDHDERAPGWSERRRYWQHWRYYRHSHHRHRY